MNIKKLYDKVNINNQTPLIIDAQTKREYDSIIEFLPIYNPVPLKMIKNYSLNSWRYYMGISGTFQLITVELVSFIKHLIKNKKAIEICCGNGTLAKNLNIPATDRMLTNGTGNEAADLILKSSQDETNKYTSNFPDYVEKLTAHQAIKKYIPDIVIGCWVTQKNKGRKLGSAFGVEEDKILNQVETYIHCGSSVNPIHSEKYINKIKHWTIEADWLIDRASLRGPSQLKIWTKNEPAWDDFPPELEFDIII